MKLVLFLSVLVLWCITLVTCMPPAFQNGIVSISPTNSDDDPEIQQNFVMNNEQEGSFAFLFDRRGQKSFDFQDWKGSSTMTMTPINVLNAHLFTTPEDALVIYENSFGAGGTDTTVLFQYANFKLTCQRDSRVNSVVRITTHGDKFFLVHRINCDSLPQTAQDYFIMEQALRHLRI